MMSQQVTVIVLEADAAESGLIAARLETVPGIAVARLGAGPADLARIAAPDVVVLGPSRLSNESGEAIARLHRRAAGMAIVKILAPGGEVEAPRLARLGVVGFVAPDADVAELACALRTVREGGGYVTPHLFSAIFTALKPQGLDPAMFVLTAREQEVLGLVGLNHANKEIARRLGLSVRTVETHRLNIRKKTGVGSRREFAEIADRLRFIQSYRFPEAPTEVQSASGFHEIGDEPGEGDA
jgi:two-component system nitrate/nitrite response regulator NarL